MALLRPGAYENVIRLTDPSLIQRTLAALAITGLLVACLVGARMLPAASAGVPDVSAALEDLSGHAAVTSVAGEALKLLGAALIGVLITFVQRQTRRGKPLGRSMEHAQVLLCVAGALTMTIIDNSLARAFGVAGAASIIRFRTPVDDPRDVTVLFLLMALGMATGLGASGAALAGTVFVCLCLAALPQEQVEKPRQLNVLVVADGPEFPAEHVAGTFAAFAMEVEPVEVSRDAQAAVRFRTSMPAGTLLEAVNARLLEGPVRSVAWQPPKKDL